MHRSLCALTLAFLPLAAAPSAVSTTTCPDIYVLHPMVVFTVEPANLNGIEQLTLTVYSTGLCTYARATADGIESKSMMANVSPAEVSQLLLDLGGFGAGTLCDDGLVALSAPFQTLTLLRGGTDSGAHTFSWEIGLGAYGQVALRLEQFIATTFPSF